MEDETAQARERVERAREELGATASELAHELNPRVRAGRAVETAREDARTRADRAAAAIREDPRRAAGIAAVVVALLWWRRRRR